MTMYEECIQGLGYCVEFSEKNSQEIKKLITDKIEFTWYERIDWSRVENKKVINSFDQLNRLKDKDVYLFWDIEEHVVKTTLKNIFQCWDNISALGTRTWIIGIEMDFFLEFYDELLLGFSK